MVNKVNKERCPKNDFFKEKDEGSFSPLPLINSTQPPKLYLCTHYSCVCCNAGGWKEKFGNIWLV